MDKKPPQLFPDEFFDDDLAAEKEEAQDYDEYFQEYLDSLTYSEAWALFYQPDFDLPEMRK